MTWHGCAIQNLFTGGSQRDQDIVEVSTDNDSVGCYPHTSLAAIIDTNRTENYDPLSTGLKPLSQL
jgi:hypothetical protein